MNEWTIFCPGPSLKKQGYFQDRLENARTNHKEARWKNETAKFEKIRKECGKYGIEISRKTL